MLKKTMKYVDYNGVEQERDFYFHLSKADVIRMELSSTGGLEAMVRRLMEEVNGREIVNLFEQIILESYGEKTVDGRFEKSPELSKKFKETAAYSDLFVELVTNADAASAFVNGIIDAE